MGWTIPDKGEGDNDLQSILFQEYLDCLVEGIQGLNCVVSGCAVTGNANLAPSVAKGAVLSNGTLFAVTAATVTITTADATNPRLDLVVIDSSGAKQVRAGTPSATPKPPARTANDVILAVVYVPATATSLATSKCIDMRVIRDRNVTLKRTTTAVTFNTTSAIQTYFTITLPNGLFLTGRVLRLRCGGTMLLNSGTPTVTLTIAYGGTTLVADVSTAATADADRLAWFVEFDLVAVSSTSQQCNGIVTVSPVGAKTAPTTGLGLDLINYVALTNVPIVSPFNGTAAVDSDAADRALTVQWTMNVSNAADEVSMTHGYAELV